jgi:hypothetical protein
MQRKNGYGLTVFALVASLLTAATALPNSHSTENSGVQLEIRQYRFSRYNSTTDRLVLEFERKDHSADAPQAKVESGHGGEWTIDTGNVVLLGAIPESLITDSYKKTSRFLGDISVNMESPTEGFSIKVATKKNSHVSAQWLQNPTRLVIDTQASREKHAPPRQAASFELKAPHRPGIDDLACFPANSKVSLTVTFQPNANRQEEIQNIRVNTAGTTLAPEEEPPPDAIVCYPRLKQVAATLSFEDHIRNHFLSQESQTSKIFTPAENAPPVTKTTKTFGNEADLDPGAIPHTAEKSAHSAPPALPLPPAAHSAPAKEESHTAPFSLGQLPLPANNSAARAPAEHAPGGGPAAEHAPTPPAPLSPLGLLPALNK